MIARNKIIMAVMVLCFAILQALLPFIHGHLDHEHLDHRHVDAQHHTQETGLHLSHDIDELNHAKYHVAHNAAEPDFAEHHLNAHSHSVHSVSVASAIKQDIDILIFSDTAAFVLLIFCLVSILFVSHQYYPPQLFVHKKVFQRLLPAPRAPPYLS